MLVPTEDGTVKTQTRRKRRAKSDSSESTARDNWRDEQVRHARGRDQQVRHARVHFVESKAVDTTPGYPQECKNEFGTNYLRIT
jgi:hypothetical protein